MRSTNRIRARLQALALCTILLLVWAPALHAATPKPDESQMPDALVWIDARNPAASWVSITYPKVVPKATAEMHLGVLLRETGWIASDLAITEGSIMKSGENAMTSVEFSIPAAFDPASGYLPIEPLVRAFQGASEVQIQYVVPQTFQFRGLGDFENKYVRIKLYSGNNAYRYSVRFKVRQFHALDLPPPSAPKTVSLGRMDPAVKMLILALALVTATLAFVVCVRFTGKRRRSDN